MKDRSVTYQKIFFSLFWFYATVSFIIGDIFVFLEPLRTYLMFAADCVLALLGICCLRHKIDYIIVGVFTILALVVSLVLNKLSIAFTVNGFRDFFGILFCYPICRYFWDARERHDRFIAQLDKELFRFLVLQSFCIVYQFFAYGTGDLVGGSLGAWRSGEISLLIYLISFYLLSKRIDRHNIIDSVYHNWIYLVLLFPTFLNETKISFVMLALYFILLMPIDRKMFVRLLAATPIFAFLAVIGFMTYRMTADKVNQGKNIFSREYLVEYMIMDIDEAEGDAKWNMENNSDVDIPRITKFLLLQQIDSREPGHILTGFGVGHFKGGTNFAVSEFYNEFDWYLLGTIPYLIHIYLQLGIAGVVWLLCFLPLVFIRKPKLYRVRDLNLQLYIIITIFMVFFYIDVLRQPMFCMIVFALALACWREGSDEEAGEETADVDADEPATPELETTPTT